VAKHVTKTADQDLDAELADLRGVPPTAQQQIAALTRKAALLEEAGMTRSALRLKHQGVTLKRREQRATQEAGKPGLFGG